VSGAQSVVMSYGFNPEICIQAVYVCVPENTEQDHEPVVVNGSANSLLQKSFAAPQSIASK
jgi:hypothetical protein